MSLTAAQIVTLACQDAKCPGFVAQGGQYLNAALQDLCQNYDLDAALGTFIFTFNSVTGNGSGPYTLPADFLRTQVKDGKDEFFYTLNGVPYPLIQVTKAEYDWLVQTPGFSSYPYNYATDLSQTPAQLFVWPPASGGYPCTMRYYKLMPDIVTPETSAVVPWFKNTMILQRSVAGRLMGLTGDSRQAEYLGDDAQRYPLGAGTLLNTYLKNVEDREGAVHTVGRDRRRWGRPFDQLKNTKNIGWAIAAALMFLLAVPDAHAQKTKVQIDTEITTQFIDNTSGAITPAILRGITSDIVNSIMPTAPVVSGHAAVFDGTTGLLKDLGSSIVPGVALAGNIAFFTDTAGLTLGASPVYQTSNPGNAALFSQVANPPSGYTTLYNAMQVCSGPCIPSAQQFGTNNLPIRQGIVGTLTIPAGDTTTFQTCGVCGYAITYTAERGTNTGPGAVGIFGQGLAGVTNADTFGGNLIATNTNGDQNSIGFNMNYMAALELDVLIWQTSPGVDATVVGGHAYGLTIAGASNMSATIAKSSGIVVDRLSFPNNIPWDYGFQTYPGATNYAVVAGPATLGLSTRSQYISAQGVDGSNNTRSALFYADSGGNAIISPFLGTTGIVSLDNGNGQSLLAVSSAYGGGKVRVAALTVAGVLVNAVTTGELSSVPTLANSYLTNPSTTVNGQTCTLGGTCTVTAAAAGITVGTTTVGGGTTTRVLFENAGVLGEYTISGTGNVAMTTNAVFTTPNLGTPSAIVLTSGTGLPTTGLTGTLQAAQEPAHTGDVTNTAGSLAMVLATAQPAVHTWALAQTFTVAPVFTDASGSRTALGLGALATVTPGTGVATALAVNIGSAGAFVTFNGALGTPSSGVGTNITGVNAATLGGATFAAPGAIGGSTPSTGAFTTVTASTSITSPLQIGGSGTTGTQFTLQTTTGVGTTDAFAFKGGNNGASTFGTWATTGLTVMGASPSVTVQSSGSTTSSSASTQTVNATAAVNATMIANDASRTTNRWGLGTIGNWAEYVDFGTNGVVFGEFANAPVLFGTNALERARISAAGCFGVGTTTDCGAANFLVSGHLLASGTAPTISSCGVSPTIGGGDNFGTVTAGTGILSSCVVNFAKTWGATPRCVASSSTAIASLTVTASTTQLTIGGTSLTSDVINWVCGATA